MSILRNSGVASLLWPTSSKSFVASLPATSRIMSMPPACHCARAREPVDAATPQHERTGVVHEDFTAAAAAAAGLAHRRVRGRTFRHLEHSAAQLLMPRTQAHPRASCSILSCTARELLHARPSDRPAVLLGIVLGHVGHGHHRQVRRLGLGRRCSRARRVAHQRRRRRRRLWFFEAKSRCRSPSL